MKPFDFFKTLPKEAVEGLSFFCFVLAGSTYKMIQQNQKGIKLTIKKILIETFSSFFCAAVVYALLNQFLQCSTFFTCMMCAVAGSMSSNRIETVVDVVISAAKKRYS